MANDVVHSMDAWTIILMLGAAALWLSLGGAVVYLTHRPPGGRDAASPHR